MSQSINTLGEFLQQGGAHYQVFDLGRCLAEIGVDQFDRIERQQQPYPFPIQRQAQLAILFRNKHQPDNDYLWFIQLPLDERGLLNVAARDHYLEFVVGALGHEITGALSDEQEQQLKQNPYLWTPNDNQRAALHARIAKQRGAAPSLYFDDAEAFLNQQAGTWQNIGLQGIHDCAARLTELPSLAAAIGQQFNHYPADVRQALAIALEHQQITAKLRDELVAVVADKDTAEPVKNDAMRALASCALDGSVQKLMRQQLQTALNADQLTIIAARLWPVLTDEKALTHYLDAIASLDSVLFDALFQDITSLPDVRPQILSLLAMGRISDTTMQALSQLKATAQGAS